VRRPGEARGRRLAAALIAALLPAAAGAQNAGEAQTPPPGPPPGRGKLALVLSGGGARGAAHIGVLKVMEELHIVPDLVVGTSMGSIVGGLYAAGWKPDEIEKLLQETDFKQVFIDKPARRDKSYRRRQDDVTYLIEGKLRFRDWKPYIPAGLLGGQRLDTLLQSICSTSTGETDFDRFPIPYRAIGADIVSGKPVVMDHGSLATAMRASMSVAGAFAPVEWEGHLLVDGGAVANLPVGIAQSLGAERVIAVDISSPLSGQEELKSVMSIFSQFTGLLTVGNRDADVKRLKPDDVLIIPELGDISFSDFHRATEAVAIGETAARGQIDALHAYSSPDEAWTAFLTRHRRRDASHLVLDEVRLENTSFLDDRVIWDRIQVPTGVPVDGAAVARSISRLSSLDWFGTITTTFERSEGRGVLTFHVPPKPYSRNSVQFGLSLHDDFRGGTSYTLAARHQWLAMNRMGGEWTNIGQLGDRAIAQTGFYQPLSWNQQWFADVNGGYRRDTFPLYFDHEQVAEYERRTVGAGLDIGRIFRDSMEVRIGARRSRDQATTLIGDPLFPDLTFQTGSVHAVVRADTLDSTVFPHRGIEFTASYRQELESLGSELSERQFLFAGRAPMTFGRETFEPYLEFANAIKPHEGAFSFYLLGGLGRISGLGEGELLGVEGGLARLAYYHELHAIKLGNLTQRLYAGASIEAGRTFLPGEPMTFSNPDIGGGVFAGAQTVIGPILFGFGLAEGGRHRYYFVLGERF